VQVETAALQAARARLHGEIDRTAAELMKHISAVLDGIETTV
jgi:hypothetical protein